MPIFCKSRPSVYALLLLPLVVAGCSKPKPASVYVDPALAVLLPGDTQMLLGIRVKDLRNSPYYSRLERTQLLRPLDDFAARTGIDPRENVLELLLASDGKNNLLFARGKFAEPGQDQPSVRLPGMLPFTYRGVPFFGTEESAVMFVNTSTAVIGKTALLRQVLDSRDTPAVPQQVLDKAKEIPWGNQIWMVSLGLTEALGQMLPSSGNAANLRRIFGSVGTVTAGIDVSQTLRFEARGRCESSAAAGMLAGTLQGFLALARMQTPQDQPGLRGIYESLKIEPSGESVAVSAHLDRSQTEALLNLVAPPVGDPRQ